MGISRSFRGLQNKLRVWANGIPNEAERVTKKVALAVDQAAVVATPVLTGRARSNWVTTVGAPFSGEAIPPPGPWDVTGQRAIDQGESVIGGYQLALGPIFITNNVPYIERLEAGHSPQASEGMLKQAIEAGQVVAKREKLRIGS